MTDAARVARELVEQWFRDHGVSYVATEGTPGWHQWRDLAARIAAALAAAQEAERRAETLAQRLYDADLREENLREANAALRAERDLEREWREAALFTVVETIGGTVEGHPTSRINYLQRLRELVAVEAERDRLAAALREYIAADERALRYASVMLGVDEDGNGPGESKTGAVVTLRDRLLRAYRALGEDRP